MKKVTITFEIRGWDDCPERDALSQDPKPDWRESLEDALDLINTLIDEGAVS